MSGFFLKALLICGIGIGSGGCKRSNGSFSIPADPDARQAELARIEEEIRASPADGNLHVARLTILLAEDPVDWRARELWASLYQVKGGSDILVGLLNHPSTRVRCNAIRLAGESRMAAAISALRRRAEDRNPQVRRTALWALRQNRDTQSFYLYALLLKDSDWSVRAEAALALGMFPNADAVHRLAAAMSDPDEFVQYCAGESLLRLANPQTRPVFEKIFNAPDDSVQKSIAAFALAKLGHQEALLYAERVLRKPDHAFRTLAAHSLAAGDADRAERIFIELIGAGERQDDLLGVMRGHLEAAHKRQ